MDWGAVPSAELEFGADATAEVAALLVAALDVLKAAAFFTGTTLDRGPFGVSNSMVLPGCSMRQRRLSAVWDMSWYPCVTHAWWGEARTWHSMLAAVARTEM